MIRKSKVGLWIFAAAVVGAAVVLIIEGVRPRFVTFVSGAVLTQDADPRKQAPIPNVEITVENSPVTAKSDSSGFFRLELRTGIWPGTEITLRFRHPDYKPLEVADRSADRICVVRMIPQAGGQDAAANGPEVLISDIRVRYAMKNLTTINIGSMVKAFEVVSEGNIPCERVPSCSPDGKWKATANSEPFDAGEGHAFRNARVSCIAGPCPFTRIEAPRFSRGGRIVEVSVLNWSDTATFLFEAEVIHTMPTDVTRQLYPAIFGRNMNFTLPPEAQGASIEAEMNGAAIVFPLGPTLTLSWAACSMQVASDKTKRYSCELKPEYRFR
jgi:hypothetical protein